jgi:microcystin-dependent protein
MAFVNFLDIIYPVGSIYISVDSLSPASIIGGSWEQIKGRFLLGSGNGYSVLSTGGEEEHQLINNELPTTIKVPHSKEDDPNHDTNWSSLTSNSIWTYGHQDGALNLKVVGGGQPHNNMPPYLVVNLWRRVS